MTRPEEPTVDLTLLEVALLVEGNEMPPASKLRLRRFHRADPRLEVPIRQLQALARDAGVEGLVNGVFHNLEFDRLLAAGDWAHPVEVLDPHGDVGLSYSELLAIADARAARSEHPGRIPNIREKLARAVAEEATKDELVRKILEPVLGKDPDEVKRLFSQALAELWNSLSKRRTPADPPAAGTGP